MVTFEKNRIVCNGENLGSPSVTKIYLHSFFFTKKPYPKIVSENGHRVIRKDSHFFVKILDSATIILQK